MRNTFGHLFTLTTFGESHGPSIGGVLDGCPAGLPLDIEAICQDLQRRRPGSSHLYTTRDEQDNPQFLSGIFNGVTTGAPIAFITENNNQNSQHYDQLEDIYRPGHADVTYQLKYGIRDHRGGGRASGRETWARVVAGAIAKQLLARLGISIYGYASQIGAIKTTQHFTIQQLKEAHLKPLSCPDREAELAMKQLIEQVKTEQDSIGGVVSVVVHGVPIGWGEPVFSKLQAMLANAIFSIGGVKGFEYGAGFNAAALRGSQMNDPILAAENNISFTTNNAGGILGGISNGDQIYFNVAFKPTPSIALPQHTIDKNLQHKTININGRHDPCIVPRAIPVVEAMTALSLYDAYLMASHQNF